MSIFNKKNILPVVVLVSICLVVAVLVGVINMITAPLIEEYEAQKVYDSLREVLDGTFETAEIPEGTPSTVTGLYRVTDKDGSFKGHVVTVEKQGYASKIAMTIGIDKDGKTTKVVITAQQETHGKNIDSLITDLSSGVSADTIADVETVTGATKTSNYIKEAVADAFKAIGFENVDDSNGSGENDNNTEVDEIKALAEALVGEGAVLVKADFKPTALTKAIYRDENGSGYVAHIVVMSAHYEGVVETETLLYVGNDLKIKGIEKLQWNVSEAKPEWGYNPPNDETVNNFYQGLVGNDSATLGDVDLSTGATNTTTNLVNSVIAAISDIEAVIAAELPTSETQIKVYAEELVGEGATFVKVDFEATEYTKLIYKSEGGEGYVAYIVVMSTHYEGQVETETLVYVGNDLSIKGIKKLQWNVSEAKPEWGYNPPSEDTVNDFYQGLVGKDSETLGDVDLSTGATNTTTAMVGSVKEAIDAVEIVIYGNLPSKGSEIKAHALDLVGEGNTFTEVSFEECDYLKRLYKVDGGKGYVGYIVVMSTNYEGMVETETLVYVGTDLKIKGVKKIQWNVSEAKPEWGYNPPSTETVDSFYQGLAGKDNATLGDVDLTTGATNTTTKLVNSISEALVAIENYINGDLPSTDAEIRDHATDLVGEGNTLTEVTFENADYLKKLYKVDGVGGYIAYIVVMSTHYEGQVETETLLWVGDDLSVKGIKKLQWNVSEAKPEWGYNPPSGETVDSFYQGLVGKNEATLGDVDLSTGATNTTTAMVNSVLEALEVIDYIVNGDLPTSEREIGELANALVGSEVSLVPVGFENAKYLKRLYEIEGGDSYIAYIVVMSTHYEGMVETETLLWVGKDLTVKGIKKLQWNTSDAAPDWGYNPPSEDEVDAFYAALVGKQLNDLGDVDLSTGATNTTTLLMVSITEAINKVDDAVLNGSASSGNATIKELAEELVGEGATLVKIDFEEGLYTKIIYEVNGGEGYVAYILVMSTHYEGQVETETLVYVGNDMKIKGIKKLQWNVSEANPEWGYNPPSEDEVLAFYQSLVGKDSETLGDVDLSTGATNTTTAMVNSVLEALDKIDSIGNKEDYTARIIGIVILVAVVACPIGIGIYNYAKRRKTDE